MIVTQPPYHRGDPVHVQCPFCGQVRTIGYSWLLAQGHHRCRSCAMREVNRNPQRLAKRWAAYRAYKEQIAQEVFHASWDDGIQQLYCDQHASLSQIAATTGMSVGTIRADLKRAGVSLRSRGGANNCKERMVFYVPLK